MKITDSRRHDLRHRIAQAQAQPRCLYGPELKRKIAAYTAAQQAQGATLREIATELGLSYKVLCTWMRHAKRRQDAGKLPFERTPRNAPSMHDTTSPAPGSAAAPLEHDESPYVSELWLLVRAEHVHLTVETRETLLRWLSAPPRAEPPVAAFR